MKRKKRIFSLMLALILCIATIPTSVFAVDTKAAENSGKSLGGSIEYLDENGSIQTVDATEIEANSTTLENGWYVVNDDITISERITVNGDVHLILADNAQLNAQAGITVSDSNSLTIYAQSADRDAMGSLKAVGGENQAGIGGESGKNCGQIVINGGNINATGGNWSAGIGGIGVNNGPTGYYGGRIIINGGKITATGGEDDGAGIGGGRLGFGVDITINGGDITAVGGPYAAGIGSGNSDRSTSNIQIHGGTIKATGGGAGASWGDFGGAGIGGGHSCYDTINIEITGGQIEATGQNGGAGIGTGHKEGGNVVSGSINISSGTITAIGGTTDNGQGGAGIGGGYGESYGNITGSRNGSITISGGTITAIGGTDAPGIGNLLNDNNVFYTGENGNAVIYTNSISDKNGVENSNCIVFTPANEEGQPENGIVYGDVTLGEDLTVDENQTLTVPEGSTLTIPEDTTLIVSDGATAVNNGTVNNQGKLEGSFSESGTGSVNYPGIVTMEIIQDGKSVTEVAYSSSITIKAAVTDGTNHVSNGTVVFYQGEVKESNKLNNQPINVNNGEATYTIDSLAWTPGSYTINAVYIPAEDSGILENSVSTKLTVGKAEQSAPAAPTMASRTTNSIALNPVTITGHGDVEYGYTMGDETSVPEERWQSESAFDGLNPSTVYTFYARYVGDDFYKPSSASAGLTATTLYIGTVTVESDGNGTASASITSAVEESEITLTVTPAEGYHFDKWEVTSGDVIIKDNKFTMPDEDVKIKAIFTEHSYTNWTPSGNGTHTGICVCGMTTTETCSGGTATCADKAICTTCGGEYGELNPTNHSNLVKTEAKAATHMAEGNTEYWHCDGCDKYFSDEAGTKEITLEDTVIPKLIEDTEIAENLNQTSKSQETSPQTGDESNIALVIGFMLVAGATAVGAAGCKRKK